MKKQQWRPLINSLVLAAGLLFSSGCSDEKKPVQEQKAEGQRDETAVDQATQEQFQKKLVELGIPVHQGASLVEIRRKAKGGSLLYAAYMMPYSEEKTFDAVKKFYEKKLKEALAPKGWKKAEAQENMILYRKGFEIFYAEFSKAIVLPDKKKIRIALHYGK